MSPIADFPTEQVVLHKLSGEVIEDIHALVAPTEFHIDDVSVLIDEGDFFERGLPNGAKEYYKVTACNFYKGSHAIPDYYHVQVIRTQKTVMEHDLTTLTIGNIGNKKVEPVNRGPYKLLISHSTSDKEYMEAFVELLEDIGMPDEAIICTSVPGHGIPGGAKIYEWLREQFVSCNLRVIFALSHNYYNSPACLNEMGAAWVTKTTDTLLLLPEFGFSDIKGCVDPTQVGIVLGGDETELKHRLTELKETLITEHSLPSISSTRWERHRDMFIRKVRDVAERKKALAEKVETDNARNYIPVGAAEARVPNHISVESAFLIVYAASSADGQIMRLRSLLGTDISAAGKVFMKDRSARETARWQSALDNLVDWKWVKSIGSKGQIFQLTARGYEMADMLKENMGIDTDREPLDELEEFN